jgi:diaminohydroxyphosphoribosylaminopyrimidine deaminase/5-amino-6-(5-phosphoribosylamino)uracil reductase
MLTDHDFLRQALALGRRNRGMTGANPSVGCVIVNGEGHDKRIVGRAVTARGGRPHAETIALERAGAAARGATAYVTLEPCSHQGRTPPCTKALIDAGIARVVYPFDDPDPRIKGRGRTALERAGVKIDTGLLIDRARDDLIAFLTRLAENRPFVQLKLAISVDGKIAAGPGKRTEITGALAQRRVHLMRARADAILIGIETALVDDPLLTCRLEGMENCSPARVILDSHARLPLASRLVETTKDVPVWLITTAVAGDAKTTSRLENLARAGVDILRVPAGGGGLDPGKVLSLLAERGISNLLVEGGSRIAGSFAERDLVDELILIQSPHPIGAMGVNAIEGRNAQVWADGGGFALLRELTLHDDHMSVYRRVRPERNKG